MRRFLVCLLALASGCRKAEPPKAVPVAADRALHLTLATFNIRYENPAEKDWRAWANRIGRVVRSIRGIDPDVFGIQESLHGQSADLWASLPDYDFHGVGRDDGKRVGEYSAILVNTQRFGIQESGTFWLSDTPGVPNSRTWGNQVTRICTWAKLYDREAKQTLHFYNTHLDHESPEARKKGTELILSRIAARQPAGPVILTGDLNAREEDPLHAAIKAAGLADVWRAVHPEATAEQSETIHQFTGATTGARIDYIYASPDFKAVDAEVIRSSKNGNYPSDHYPVRATVKIED